MSDPAKLIGPKPEPVPGPKHPLPWEASTGLRGNVVDANRCSVLSLRTGAHDSDERYELAELIAEAVNAYYGDPTLKDPAPLRDFVSASGTRKVFEVEPGWAVYATSREAAVERYAAQPTRRTYGTAIDASFLRDYKVVVPAPALRDFKDKDGDAWFEVKPGQVIMADTRTKAVEIAITNPSWAYNLASHPYAPLTDTKTGEVFPEGSEFKYWFHPRNRLYYRQAPGGRLQVNRGGSWDPAVSRSISEYYDELYEVPRSNLPDRILKTT